MLILQEITPTEKTVLFEATMTLWLLQNETNGEGYRYDITSFRVYKNGSVCITVYQSITDYIKEVWRKLDFIS